MTKLDDLTDSCLLMVLDQLRPRELFKMLRVNRRLNQLANKKIGVKIKVIEFTSLPIKNQRELADCSHLDGVSNNQVLCLDPIFNSGEKYPEALIPKDRSKRAGFFRALTRCTNVKSINFGFCHLMSGAFLLEVFQRRPEIECIRLGKSGIEDDWNQFLNRFGSKIIHLARDMKSEDWWVVPSEIRMMKMVAMKCRNIKHVGWVIDRGLPRNLIEVLKLLPKSCRITFKCNYFDKEEGFFEDVVDELDIEDLDWSFIGHRCDRLSKLKFDHVLGPFHAVEFNGLKTFDYRKCYKYSDQAINCLLASRFPLLEEFCFDASAGLTEDNYSALFQRMASVKKLVIVWKKAAGKLPQSSINQLKNLETICLEILNVENNWQPNDFLQQLEHYVDEIRSLKKLTVDVKGHGEWEKSVKDEIKRIIMKQSRVKINLISPFIL